MPQPSRLPPSRLLLLPWPTHLSSSNAAFAADGRPQIVTEAAAGRATQWLACKAWCTGATSKCGCSTVWRTGSMHALLYGPPRRHSPRRRESRSPISEAPAPQAQGQGQRQGRRASTTPKQPGRIDDCRGARGGRSRGQGNPRPLVRQRTHSQNCDASGQWSF